MARSKTGGRRRVALIATLATVVLSAGMVLWLWTNGTHTGVVTLWIALAVVFVGLVALVLNIPWNRSSESVDRAADPGTRQPQGPAWLAAFAQVVAALATLLSTGAAGYAARGVQQPAPTVTATVTVRPGGTGPVTTPAAGTTSRPATTALTVPQCASSGGAGISTPQAQRGYDLVWQGCTAIDPAGVVFDVDGPHKANGADFTVAYQPDAGGWRSNATAFIRWTAPGLPGPSVCEAEFHASDPVDAYGNRTAVGRAYCLLTSGTDSGGPYHIYLQVYDVTASKVRVALWEWRDHR